MRSFLESGEHDDSRGFDPCIDHPDALDSLVAVEEAAERDALSQPATLELIAWDNIGDTADPIVEGVLHPGRWTAVYSEAKQGKSELLLNIAVHVSEGRDPFDRTPVEPATVLYVDAEMGRLDMRERLVGIGYNDPSDLSRFRACDIPPRLDIGTDAELLLNTVEQLGVTVVCIDGINGTVTGGENDDTTWRAFFDLTIGPLKRAGVAVVTNDNSGKDSSKGSRGSSVKNDKADAVVKLKRNAGGVKLTTTHRRTVAYPLEWSLSISGLDGSEPVRYHRTNGSMPGGTVELAARLHELDFPIEWGRDNIRRELTDLGDKYSNEVISAAIKYRKQQRGQVSGQVETTDPGQVADQLR